MTLTEFIEHLKSQPWELDYVANLLTSSSNNYPIGNFINVFSWSNCPNRSASFWSSLHTDIYINTSSHISRTQFVQIITDIYSQSHPELFI